MITKKKRYVAFTSTTIVASLLLSGCQLLGGYKKIDEAQKVTVPTGKIYPIVGETNIACLGTYHCEIIQIDGQSIISPETHQPVDLAMVINRPSLDEDPLFNNKSVKLVPLSSSNKFGLMNYYARVKPIKREVHINFYPETNLGYVERFAIIHEFVDATYQLRAYRQKSAQHTGSLLENASPDPLCVDLIENGVVKRHFCKETDIETQGEFVEVKALNRLK